MNPIGRIVNPATPLKESYSSKSAKSENSNPNLGISSPNRKQTNANSAQRNAKPQNSASKNPYPATYISPRNRIRERKFIVAKKKGKKYEQDGDPNPKVHCKCKENGLGGDSRKCLCVAYESLRASQEEFFKNGSSSGVEESSVSKEEYEEIEKGLMIHDLEAGEESCGEVMGNEPIGLNDLEFCEMGDIDQMGMSTIKRRRDKLMEEARNSVPESGAGRVMHLVKAFEKLLSIPKETEDSNDGAGSEEVESGNNKKKPMKWALPGLQPPNHDIEFSTSFAPSELILNAENLGLNSRGSILSSCNSSQGSISSRTSAGGRRSSRNSMESCATTLGGSRWMKKQLKVTSQKPFKLRTEQRGKLKEEEFIKKMQEMMEEQERLRIPIAQGLPWTTDEPECLMKPPAKGNTRPVDLKLHSDLRAMERAEFDQQIAEKMSLIEQYKLERERQQKLEEEEEIKRLRKELIPKAQPMPYFDRPFIPRRSSKNPTIPREPRFHIPQHKKIKCALSWNDFSPYTYHQ